MFTQIAITSRTWYLPWVPHTISLWLYFFSHLNEPITIFKFFNSWWNRFILHLFFLWFWPIVRHRFIRILLVWKGEDRFTAPSFKIDLPYTMITWIYIRSWKTAYITTIKTWLWWALLSPMQKFDFLTGDPHCSRSTPLFILHFDLRLSWSCFRWLWKVRWTANFIFNYQVTLLHNRFDVCSSFHYDS